MGSDKVDLFFCPFCQYNAESCYKIDRHINSDRHQIAKYGIICCGLTYYEKHKWINHKKSLKHRTISKNGNTNTTINRPKKLETIFCYQLDEDNLERSKKEKYEEMMLEVMLRSGKSKNIDKILNLDF